MTKDKTVTMSRELIGVPRDFLEVIANSSQHSLTEINAAIQQARIFLAAPVVERQPVGHLFRLRGPEDRAWNFFGGSIAPDSMAAYEVKPVFDSPPAPVATYAIPCRKYLNKRVGEVPSCLNTCDCNQAPSANESDTRFQRHLDSGDGLSGSFSHDNHGACPACGEYPRVHGSFQTDSFVPMFHPFDAASKEKDQ